MSLLLERIEKEAHGETYLSGIDLELLPGHLYVLLGPTLAGKTSLMRLMAGLDRPGGGKLVENGKDVTGMAPQRRRVAMVYQQFINYPSLDVFDNIASPLRRQGLRRAEVEARVEEVARLLHIEHLLKRLPAQLSGGQQQRCAIARALVKDADLLLLDEPLVNLDYKLREELRGELKALFERRQAIVVYATTEPMEALVMGGEVVVMDEGRVLQAGPTLDVYHRPASARVGAVFSDPPMNMIDGRIEGGCVVLGDEVDIPVPPHMQGLPPGPYRFGVRSNHLVIAAQGAACTPLRAPGNEVRDLPSPAARIPAEVELAEISGSETFVHVRHHDVSWVAQGEGVHEYGLGQTVEMLLDARTLFVFARNGALEAAPAGARGG